MLCYFGDKSMSWVCTANDKRLNSIGNIFEVKKHGLRQMSRPKTPLGDISCEPCTCECVDGEVRSWRNWRRNSGLEFGYVKHFRLQCFYLFRVHCQAIGCKSCGKFHFSQIERKRELWACFSSEVCIALYWNIESVRVAYITIHFFNCIKTVQSLCMSMLCLVLSVAHSLFRPLLSSLSTAPSISPSFFLIFTQSLERSSNSPYLSVVFFCPYRDTFLICASDDWIKLFLAFSGTFRESYGG